MNRLLLQDQSSLLDYLRIIYSNFTLHTFIHGSKGYDGKEVFYERNGLGRIYPKNRR